MTELKKNIIQIRKKRRKSSVSAECKRNLIVCYQPLNPRVQQKENAHMHHKIDIHLFLFFWFLEFILKSGRLRLDRDVYCKLCTALTII